MSDVISTAWENQKKSASEAHAGVKRDPTDSDLWPRIAVGARGMTRLLTPEAGCDSATS